MCSLLTAVREKQVSEKLSTRAFARKLGLTEGCLIHLYQGRRRPGVRFLHAVLTTYPDMEGIVLEHIRTNGSRIATG